MLGKNSTSLITWEDTVAYRSWAWLPVSCEEHRPVHLLLKMASISTWWVPQITPHPEQCCCCRRCLCLKPLFNYKEEDRSFSGWVSCLMRQNETSHTQPHHDTPRQLGYLTNLMSMTSALLWLVVLTSASISLILCLPEVKKHHSSSLVKKIFFPILGVIDILL